MRINYTQVKKQAMEIEHLGDELKTIEISLRSLISEIPSYWKGEAASAYIKVCDQLRNEISLTEKNITNVSREIRTIADRIQREDEEIARLAATLKQQ